MDAAHHPGCGGRLTGGVPVVKTSQRYATDLQQIRRASELIDSKIHRTPVLTCTHLNAQTGLNLFFKCEPFQKVGAFKIRGATYAIECLTDAERKRGVVTHSSGNHAQALALAARNAGVEAHIVMPTNSPKVKKNAVIGYGAYVYDCVPTLAARETTANGLVQKLGAVMIPPYNDERIITGQGTLGLELYHQVPDLDFVMIPIGGGGLCAGSALALHELNPQIKVMGVEPKGADDAYRSRKANRLIPQTNPQTIADGLRTSMGDLTWPVIRDIIADVQTVSEASILEAMRLIWMRMKVVVEPSGAVGLAAVLEHLDEFKMDQRVAIVLTGGNVDIDQLPWHPAS